MIKSKSYSRILSVLLALTMVIAMVPSDFAGIAYATGATPISDAASFAAMEAGGSYILTDDITVEAPYASAFTGTFDGDGHTVTLAITSSSAKTGLFSELGSGATVKNLVLEGSVTSTGNNTGAVVGRVDPDAADVTIENCLNKAEIQGSRYVGGIVGCGNYGDYRIIIESCGNEANISSTGNQVGGIIGKIEGGTISNCYNTGIVKGDNQRAGIVGQALAYADSGYPYTVHVSTEISNCYSTGTIQAKEGSSNKGYPIVGAGNANKKATVTNCYALSGTGEGDGLLPPQSSGNDVVTATNCDYKTSEFMQSADFVSLLGDAFERGATYPELVAINAMQTPTASVTFTLSPADATLVIDGTKTVNGGATRTVNLAAGDHTWVVSAEGCTSQDGSISVSEDQANTAATLDGVSVTLAKDPSQFSTITFETTPANATVVVKKGETVMEPTTDGGKTYELLNTKSYTYEASTTTEGYEAATGNVDLSSATNAITLKHVESIAVSGNEASYYVGTTEEQLRRSLTVTATYNDSTTATVTSYTVSGFDTSTEATGQTVTITYKGETATFTIDLAVKPGPCAGLAGKATVSYYEGKAHNDTKYGFEEVEKDGEIVLRSDNHNVSNSYAIMTVTPLANGIITFKSKVSSDSGDKLYIYTDSTSKGTGRSDNGNWEEERYSVLAGQSLYVEYNKNYYTNSNDDRAYIKDFSYVPAYIVSIVPNVEGAEIVLKDSGNNTVSGTNGSYVVAAGAYTYTVSKFGYETATGTVTVSNADVTENVTLTALAGKTVIFNITFPEGVSADPATVTVKHGDTVMDANVDGTYTLTAGEYTYEITKTGCEKKAGTITVNDADVTKNVTLVRKPEFEEFFAGLSGITAVNDSSYPFYGVAAENGNYLEFTWDESSYKTGKITLTATADVQLSFDYRSKSKSSSYYFDIKKNGSNVYHGINTDDSGWKTFSDKLKPNDVITINYEALNGRGYFARVKNFATAPLHTLTFGGAPSGTLFEIKNGEEVVATGTGVAYQLTDGDYTYVASKFGYIDTAGSFTVNGTNVTENVTLNQQTGKSVTFSVTLPAGMTGDSTIVVKHGSDIMDAVSAGNYSLAAGDYTYTISFDGCDTITGEFTVASSDVTITKELKKTLTFADFINESYLSSFDSSGTCPLEGVYDESLPEGKYLLAKATRYYQTLTLTLNFNSAAKLSFDYFVNSGDGPGCGFWVNKGSIKILNNVSSKGWTTYTANVVPGDKIELCFKSDNANDLVKLKNFSFTPVYMVALSNVPDGATLVVKSGDQEVIPSSAGNYALENGTYTYSVSKFGFETITGTVTVNGADQTIDLPAMTASASKTLTFSIPDGAAATVSHASAGDMAGFASGNVFTLPAGETYSYVVTKADYVSARGSITLTENKTLTITLKYAGAAWDGAAKTVPQQDENGTYLIGSGAELAWFADYVNNTNGNVNAKLTANINLNDKEWSTPIGDGKNFAGTFDGNSKTISGLNGKSYGLFGTVTNGGIIKNLNVNGSVENSSGGAGGIVWKLAGTVENCSFTGTVTAGGEAGGIAGQMQSSGAIRNCGVSANIANTYSAFGKKIDAGGIVGYMYGVLENSYFIGSVAARTANDAGRLLNNTEIAGIAGCAKKTNGINSVIRNCYISATVTGPSDGIAAFAYSENANDVSVTNCYYENKGLTDGKATAKTGSEMRARAFVSALNGSGSAFNQDTESINGGFPVLAWQGGAEVFDADARAVSLDKNALSITTTEIRQACNLALPVSGANGTTIAWASDNVSVISNSGTVVLPQSGTATVTLTATITKNETSDTKTFTITVYSGSATNQARLNAIASYVNGRSVWASEIVHPDERTTVDVIKRFVSASGRDINGLTFTMTSAGTKSLPVNEDVNIAADGTINYYTGEEGSSSHKSAIYDDVAFTVSNGTESASFTCRMFISWDKEYVEGVLGSLANQITWNTIRGENATSSAVTSNLALPEGIGTASVTWQASYDQSEGELVTIERALQNENYYQRVNVIRPAGADLPVRLTGTFRFNLANRDEFPAEADFAITRTFDFTVSKDASQAQVDTERTQQSLENSFEGLITYFYGDMGEQLRLNAVKGDLQLPQPRALETSGIFQNRSSQRITYTSLTPEVMEISGYHAIIYRPLPGEESATARVKATITSRDTGRVQGEATFEFTVLPFTQAEINADKAYMRRIATDDVYVAGLLRDTENTPSAIVANLKNFSFITEENGEIVYNSGSSFGGNAVKLADLPGYDPMSSLMWRTIRSSRPTIITDENLILTKPEYDTQLILESCMTLEKYSAYGDRFAADPATYASYSVFEELCKVPVSATVTVKGLRGADPNAASRPTTMSVNVKVDGRDFGGFENITSWTYTGSTLRDHTAWDALRGALSANGYGYTGSGTYVRSLTDSHGHELGEFDFGQNSGWLYTVGGVLPDLALAQYYLEDGDRMVFYYTGEYTREPGVREKMKEAAKEELAVPETGAEIVKKEEKTDALGSKIVTVTDVNGKQASSVQLSDEAVKKAEVSGKPIEIAVSAAKPEADAKKASAVNVILPKGKEKAAVSIPVKEAETTTVLMKVNADGSFTPIVTSVVNEEGTGVVATVEDGSYIVVDNKVEFGDVKKDAWYEAGVNFAASRGLMVGVGEGKFAQETALTTAQTAAVIGRIKGEGTSESWNKAVEKFGKAEVNNRQNTISMLYEAYKEIGGSEVAVNADAVITFRDSSDISAENLEAVRWAVATGLINGVGDDLIDPLGELTRGQFGTMLERFIKLLAGIQ